VHLTYTNAIDFIFWFKKPPRGGLGVIALMVAVSRPFGANSLLEKTGK
jgi:hypothetical protein